MVRKYIIDKSDIHDLLIGRELPLSQGEARAFCVEVVGEMTNGDVMKALFPNVNCDDMAFTVHATTKVVSNGVTGSISYDFWKYWWNAPYKAEEREWRG